MILRRMHPVAVSLDPQATEGTQVSSSCYQDRRLWPQTQKLCLVSSCEGGRNNLEPVLPDIFQLDEKIRTGHAHGHIIMRAVCGDPRAVVPFLLVFSSPTISKASLGNDVHGSCASVKPNSSPQTLLTGSDCIMSLVAIPLEIVEYIIQIIAAKYPIGSLAVPRNLRSLSLTCHSIRHLVLRAYLRDLAILTQWQWEGMLRLSSSIEARYSVYYKDGGLCWTK